MYVLQKVTSHTMYPMASTCLKIDLHRYPKYHSIRNAQRIHIALTRNGFQHLIHKDPFCNRQIVIEQIHSNDVIVCHGNLFSYRTRRRSPTHISLTHGVMVINAIDEEYYKCQEKVNIL